jgi:hypothetical protein
MFPTPAANMFEPTDVPKMLARREKLKETHKNGSPSQRERNSAALNVVVGGKLNANWVELLMGWPPGWTVLPPGTGPAIGRRSRGSRKATPTASPDSAP